METRQTMAVVTGSAATEMAQLLGAHGPLSDRHYAEVAVAGQQHNFIPMLVGDLGEVVDTVRQMGDTAMPLVFICQNAEDDVAFRSSGALTRLRNELRALMIEPVYLVREKAPLNAEQQELQDSPLPGTEALLAESLAGVWETDARVEQSAPGEFRIIAPQAPVVTYLTPEKVASAYVPLRDACLAKVFNSPLVRSALTSDIDKEQAAQWRLPMPAEDWEALSGEQKKTQEMRPWRKSQSNRTQKGRGQCVIGWAGGSEVGLMEPDLNGLSPVVASLWESWYEVVSYATASSPELAANIIFSLASPESPANDRAQELQQAHPGAIVVRLIVERPRENTVEHPWGLVEFGNDSSEGEAKADTSAVPTFRVVLRPSVAISDVLMLHLARQVLCHSSVSGLLAQQKPVPVGQTSEERAKTLDGRMRRFSDAARRKSEGLFGGGRRPSRPGQRISGTAVDGGGKLPATSLAAAAAQVTAEYEGGQGPAGAEDDASVASTRARDGSHAESLASAAATAGDGGSATPSDAGTDSTDDRGSEASLLGSNYASAAAAVAALAAGRGHGAELDDDTAAADAAGAAEEPSGGFLGRMLGRGGQHQRRPSAAEMAAESAAQAAQQEQEEQETQQASEAEEDRGSYARRPSVGDTQQAATADAMHALLRQRGGSAGKPPPPPRRAAPPVPQRADGPPPLPSREERDARRAAAAAESAGLPTPR